MKLARAGGERAGRVARSEYVASTNAVRLLDHADSVSSWLARAELSTFSTSPRLLPRLVYPSHQFVFRILGEDYHVLIRSGRLDVPSNKIEVRHPVEVSAYATGAQGSDTFIHRIGSPHDLSSSSVGAVLPLFDAPLASALAAPLHPLHLSPPVPPMLPNGTPGSASKAFMTAIPIRHVAAGIQDGMSEGLERLRRELGKAPSPRPGSGSVSMTASMPSAGSVPSVPLEFNEDEMEDFERDAEEGDFGADVILRSISMMSGGEAVMAVEEEMPGMEMPETNVEPLPVEHDGEQAWQAWGPEDQAAVEDAERLDNITVGFLDEEQETIRAAEAEGKNVSMKKRRPRRH